MLVSGLRVLISGLRMLVSDVDIRIKDVGIRTKDVNIRIKDVSIRTIRMFWSLHISLVQILDCKNMRCVQCAQLNGLLQSFLTC